MVSKPTSIQHLRKRFALRQLLQIACLPQAEPNQHCYFVTTVTADTTGGIGIFVISLLFSTSRITGWLTVPMALLSQVYSMPQSFLRWTRALILAIAPLVVIETDAFSQETPLDTFVEMLKDSAQSTAPPAESEGCQGNCGWISDGCCPDDCCFPQTTARLEYLMWWGRGQNIPALVTTNPDPNARPVLSDPNTTTLFGNQGIQQNLRSGFRISVNHQLENGSLLGGRFWALEQARSNYSNASNGNPNLGIPFFNTQVPGEDALLVAFPGITTNGSVNVRTGNELLGADAWFRRSISRDAGFQMDWLAGYQFVRMNDSLFMNSTQTDINGIVVPVGTVISVADNFRTSSEFHGGTLGVVVDNHYGAWQLDLLAKVALGNMHQTVNVSGSNTVTEPGLPSTTSASGLFAQGTNSGIRSRNRLAFIPEINCNLGYRINDQWSVMMGYSFLYISDVVVAGGQIDRAINLSQNPGPLVGPVRPAPLLNSTDYWVQGLNFGVDYRF